jgi:hypothetical protein
MLDSEQFQNPKQNNKKGFVLISEARSLIEKTNNDIVSLKVSTSEGMEQYKIAEKKYVESLCNSAEQNGQTIIWLDL